MKPLSVRKNILEQKIRAMSTKDFEALEYWFETVRKDRWYDYGYFLKILKKKVTDMAQKWELSHYIGSEKEELKELIHVLDRLIADDYIFSVYENVEKKIGTIDRTPLDYEDDFLRKFGSFYKMSINSIWVEDIPGFDELVRLEYDSAEEKRKNDLIILANFFINIDKYWD